MGETCIRIDVSYGDGVYKSTDGGKTWTHLGLADTRHIARVRIHPHNPDIVYVAALGHAFGPQPAAWRLPLHQRREDLGAGAVQERQGWRC